jgi:SAM-dependent methyltransferase
MDSHLGETVLDAGAGIGTYSAALLETGRTVTALEPVGAYVDRISARFDGDSRLTCVQADLSDPTLPSSLGRRFDSVLCINVLEHIEDDLAALRNIRLALKPGGTIGILVPAHRWLFNSIDRAVGHYRRYTRREIVGKIEQSGLVCDADFYVHFFAMLGWFVSGTILRRPYPPLGAQKVYDRLTPIFQWIETAIIRRRLGGSLVVLAHDSASS